MFFLIRLILATPFGYRLLKAAATNKANMTWFTNKILALRAGQKLVDVGCGVGDILDTLPKISYVGLDISEPYIKAARQKYGSRGVFLSGQVSDWLNDPRTAEADVVLVNGVLHHVDDDEAKRIIGFAYQALKEGGRFVFFEPCYLIWQSKISTFFMSKDRGQNIRTEQEWKELVSGIFPNMTTHIVNGVNRLAYVCMIGECIRSNSRAAQART